MSEDLNVKYDYADPMLLVQRHLQECHDAIINRRDLSAAAAAARAMVQAATAVEVAVGYQCLAAAHSSREARKP